MKLYTVDTGYFKLDGGAMFGVVPKVIWNKLAPADENNLINMAMRCLLIEDADRLILIDTGIGNKQSEKFFSHYYLHGNDSLDLSLQQHGFHRNDITDVILTHLHFDHCGGAIIREGDKLVPAFANATYWSNESHWNWAVYPNDREKASFLKDNILPIQESGQLKMISQEQSDDNSLLTVQNFSDHIDLLFVNGHTESMMLPKIRYKNHEVIYMADLIPSAAHLPVPYVMAYDMFPLKTLQEKKSFLKEAADNEYILFFEHDPQIECCTVQETEKGVRSKETFRLQDISSG